MTEDEFDTAMAAAKLERQRALMVASVNRAKGYRVTEYNIQRINRSQEAIDALKCHPVFIERLRLRAEEKKRIKAAGREEAAVFRRKLFEAVVAHLRVGLDEGKPEGKPA